MPDLKPEKLRETKEYEFLNSQPLTPIAPCLNKKTPPSPQKAPPTSPVMSQCPAFARNGPWGCEDFEVLQRFASSPWQFQEPHFPQEPWFFANKVGGQQKISIKKFGCWKIEQ